MEFHVLAKFGNPVLPAPMGAHPALKFGNPVLAAPMEFHPRRKYGGDHLHPHVASRLWSDVSRLSKPQRERAREALKERVARLETRLA